MTRWVKWAVALLVLLAVVSGVMRALSARKAQQQALVAANAAKDRAVIELATTDVVNAQVRDVVQGLAVSGSLKDRKSVV